MGILDEQIEYYRQRAGEYDEWWLRQGRYQLEPAERRRWFADVAQVEAALEAFAPAGEVLEYAAGTGLWTRHLARHATRVTAVDAATEMLELNRRRLLDDTAIRYECADILAWTPPPAAFDVVFFAYWLSHIPDERLAWFWTQVATALRPGGRVFLVDSYHPHRMPDDIQQRQLNDGRTFHIVKRFWQPEELTSVATGLGWRLHVQTTDNNHILFGSGTPNT